MRGLHKILQYDTFKFPTEVIFLPAEDSSNFYCSEEL